MRGLLIGLVLTVALSGCGFHPRGDSLVPAGLGSMKVVAADPYSPIAGDLSRALTHGGAEVTEGDAPAVTLRVLSEEWSTRPLSVDQFAQVREYITRYKVEFDLIDAQSQSRLPRQKLEVTREFTYDNTAPAGSPAEQELIQRELRQQMESAILRQVDLALRPKP